jgi:hypothetical protein
MAYWRIIRLWRAGVVYMQKKQKLSERVRHTARLKHLSLRLKGIEGVQSPIDSE